MKMPVVAFLVLAACVEDRGVLDGTARAWTDQSIQTATPPLRVSLGMAALAAEVCSYELADWTSFHEVGSLTLSSPVAAWFEVDPVAQVTGTPAQAVYQVVLAQGRAFDRDVAVVLDVQTPMAAFTVSILQDNVAGATLAEALVTTAGCSGGEPGVSGSVSFEVDGDEGWSVVLPAADGEDNPVFASGDVLPSAGTLGFSGRLSPGRVQIQTGDAATIQDRGWPVSVSGPDWTGTGTLDVSAPAAEDTGT